MSTLNWKVFDLKYDQKETSAFEALSYLLFCVEFNNRIGIFRYKNQVGIETEPIEKDGKLYAFQAKYYTSSISDNKADIIDSIEKAKAKNSHLKELHFYINKEFSESTTKSKKKPQYQLDIEKSAKAEGIKIQWRVPSHIELQLSLPENQYIYDIFFNLEPNEGDLIEEVVSHNENILQAIQTEIPFGKKQIKIDRSKIIEGIAESFHKRQNIIISGEGGCGKTAIFKELYKLNYKKIPICIFKATELNVNHINDLFQFDHKFSFAQFISTYQNEPTKVFVIDSAEKLAEITNNDILNVLMQNLKEAGWSIIFTTRYSYLNDLTFHIKENYQLSYEVNDIPLISIDELISLSKEFDFSLPENPKFSERLRNLFYLNEYIQFYSNIDKKSDFGNFIGLLWKKRIQNNLIQKDNLHIERERCIINIAQKRCETGRFYINAENLPQAALFQLKQDEILGYDDTHNGYFITHDIYEEWTLNKIVSRNYANYTNTKQFFDELGNSLPTRRAFRLWLSNQLSDNSNEIENFIQEAFKNSAISQFWKDELLISVLLSVYSESFFKFFENEIVSDEFKILKRILFLLRIACTDISAIENFDIIKPKGHGWQEVIALIFKYKSEFFDKNINLVLPLLIEWCNYSKKGATTRYSGLMALSVIQKTETEKNFYINDNIEESILTVVFNSSNEIKCELVEIFDKVLTNKWTIHNDPYEGLCSKILEKPYLAAELIDVLPLHVIQLCNLFWQKRERETRDFGYDRHSIESKYGLTDEFRLDYFPASANQTPIKWLLQKTFHETLDFIIDFTNKSVVKYSQSDYGLEDVIQITLYIQEKEVKQYLSWAIWSMYRGGGSPVVPYLLQSIHMALEKILLEYSEYLKPEVIEQILTKILEKSESASLTAIVCSIVLAHPNKFYRVAMILAKTIEFFHMDSIRCSNELHAKSNYSIGYGLNRIKDTFYTDERLKTCKDIHRTSNLESVFLRYQFTGIKGFTDEQNTEFIEKLYGILDSHKSNISSYANCKENSYGILLARMDRRNLSTKISKQDDNNLLIEFKPKELSKELKEQSEQAIEQVQDTFKYSSLAGWSNFLIGRTSQDKNKKHEEYNNNPLLALSETRQLVQELMSGRKANGIFDYSIPGFSCSKLMIEHIEKLTNDDKSFCRDIIVSNVSRLHADDYDYQISDGVEASVHAIPSLLNEYPDETDNLLSIMILTLLDETSIGNYKRVCDYVIESVHNSKLWEHNQRNAQSILLGYIKLKPIYQEIITKQKKEKGYQERILKSSIFEELDKKTKGFTFEKNSFDINDIESFNIRDYEIIYQLIPSNTNHRIHLEIFRKSLPMIASQLLMDKGSYKEKSGDNFSIHKIRNHIFKRFANFILQREITEIEEFLRPFIVEFHATEEASLFISELVAAEDIQNSYEQFWHVWDYLYPKIKNICTNPHIYYLNEILIEYLLAWRWWPEGIEEWHSLKKENLSLYVNISRDLGNIPSVLYSISKVVNTIGSNFKEDGIDWIYTIISNNSLLKLGDLESNTLYYLEKFIRKYIFINKQKIKKEIRLRNKIIPILDFMIERGSIHGYLLRESVL